RDSVAAVLRHCGATVRVAESARAALAELESATATDLVITDVPMPDQDGLALLARARARDATRGAHTPVIALTALAGDEDRRRIVAAGFDRFVAKPIDPRDLAAIV